MRILLLNPDKTLGPELIRAGHDVCHAPTLADGRAGGLPVLVGIDLAVLVLPCHSAWALVVAGWIGARREQARSTRLVVLSPAPTVAAVVEALASAVVRDAGELLKLAGSGDHGAAAQAFADLRATVAAADAAPVRKPSNERRVV